MERLTVYAVSNCVEANISIVGIFSSMEYALHFTRNIYCDNDINSCWIEKIEVDLYRQGLFVYEVMLQILPEVDLKNISKLEPDIDGFNWSIEFIGYNKELEDRKEVVFREYPELFSVIVVADNLEIAFDLGKKVILEAIGNGPCTDGNFSPHRYIKTYSSETMTCSSVE